MQIIKLTQGFETIVETNYFGEFAKLNEVE